jgi:hypothetical protein
VSRRRRQLVATAPKWLVKIKVAIRRCGCSGVREALGTGGGRRQASAIDAREDVWEKEQAVNVSCLIDGAFQRRRACAICTLQLLPQGQTLTRCCPSALRVVRDGARLDVGAGSEGERGAGRRAMAVVGRRDGSGKRRSATRRTESACVGVEVMGRATGVALKERDMRALR